MPFEKAGDALFLLEAEGIEAGKRHIGPWEMALTGKAPGMPTTFLRNDVNCPSMICQRQAQQNPCLSYGNAIHHVQIV
jgi:hypothetical protein